jgi:hypothetical protein
VPEVFTVLLSLFTGFLGGWGKSWLDRRYQFDDSLLKRRSDLYPELWSLTGRMPQYPPDLDFSPRNARALAEHLRAWYFEKAGGLYMSAGMQRNYLDFQREVCGLADMDTGGNPVPRSEYERVRKLGSVLRTGMTRDLTSRQARRSV